MLGWKGLVFFHLHARLHAACSAEITENGSLWQPPKSLYPLALWRQLVGWGAHQHAQLIISRLSIQEKLAVHCCLVFKACQNIAWKYGRTQSIL